MLLKRVFIPLSVLWGCLKLDGALSTVLLPPP